MADQHPDRETRILGRDAGRDVALIDPSESAVDTDEACGDLDIVFEHEDPDDTRH